MTTTTRQAIRAGLFGSAITATLMLAAQVAAQDPDPTTTTPVTTTVTTTVTTPVAPCHHEDCPPWPSLDQGEAR